MRHDRAIHDFVACKDIVAFADDMGVVYVSGLDTLKERILRVPGVILNNAALSSTGLKCSLYMAVDACFAYLMSTDNNLIQKSLKNIDPKDPLTSKDKL